MVSTELAQLYARDLRRLRQQIAAFPDTESLWRTAPGVTNAAGTLALHLEGNLREYIGRQLGRIEYVRDRPLEFSARGMDQRAMGERIAAVAAVIPGVIQGLSEEVLASAYPADILDTPLTTRQCLMHLNGHLNYHLGQIDYLRRVTTGHGAIALAGL
jgi:hypothetical protein